MHEREGEGDWENIGEKTKRLNEKDSERIYMMRERILLNRERERA